MITSVNIKQPYEYISIICYKENNTKKHIYSMLKAITQNLVGYDEVLRMKHKQSSQNNRY